MKDIMLKIIGRQVGAGIEEDKLEFITEGTFSKDEDSLYLSYDESELSGMPGCKTTLKFTGNKVKMNRLGETVGLDTVIEFEKGKRFIGYYDTPYGAVEMEVLTNSIKNNLTEDGKGNVDIDFHISLKGLTDVRNNLNIQIM